MAKPVRHGWPARARGGVRLASALALLGAAASAMAPLAASAGAQGPAIDPALAAQYLREAKGLSDKDGGALWGARLYGATLLVDPETHAVVANQPDAEGKLARAGEVWTGALPPTMGVGNTAVRWAGVEWTMIMWPLPRYRQERLRLMMHESFHRIQAGLGLPAKDAVNNQLDTRNGRVWLELEWRALRRALWSAGAARREAIADALYFRSYRRSLFPGAAEREDDLERNEGLAEYTGYALSSAGPREFELRAAEQIDDATSRQSFARSFAYISGPAYGCLLDESGLHWRKLVGKERDFGALLARAYGVRAGNESEAEAMRRAARYDGDEIFAVEDRREAKRLKVTAEYRARFVDAPVLVLPLGPNVSWSFDPNNVAALDENSNIYPTLHLEDEWGVLDVTGGALLVREDGRLARAQVPAPKDAAARPLAGDGWKLELKPGWALAPGPRPGDFAVKKE